MRPGEVAPRPWREGDFLRVCIPVVGDAGLSAESFEGEAGAKLWLPRDPTERKRWRPCAESPCGWELLPEDPSADARSGLQLRFPVFTPSRGRARTGRLDLSRAMRSDGAHPARVDYQHIVVVRDCEKEAYWEVCTADGRPLTLLSLPPAMDEARVGAKRDIILQVARQVCRRHRALFMLDDSVKEWFGVLFPGDPARVKGLSSGADGRPRFVGNVSLWEVLRPLQDPRFADRHQILAIGFGRRRTSEPNVRILHARRQVSSAVWFNLDEIERRKVRFSQRAVIWEDIDFFYRCAPHAVQEWQRERYATEENPGNPKADALVVKCNRYMMDKDSSLAGGCSDLIAVMPDEDAAGAAEAVQQMLAAGLLSDDDAGYLARYLPGPPRGQPLES